MPENKNAPGGNGSDTSESGDQNKITIGSITQNDNDVNNDGKEIFTISDFMAGSKNSIRRGAVAEYLLTLDPENLPSPFQIEKAVLKNIENHFDIECSMKEKHKKWRVPESLSPSDIADIILFTQNVKCISCAGINKDEKYDILAVYQNYGINKGIYMDSETKIRQIAQDYNYEISTKDTEELIRILKTRATRIARNEDPDLIAVNNGLFNYRTKELMPFTPDIVFMTKSYVNYNPNAQNINIHNDEDNTDWNIEDWMNDLSDDPDIVNLLWEILGAIIRPYVSWGKSAWMYAENGNNGKGSLCKLMRNLCGVNACASIPIADFSKDFLLEHLTHSSAIIVDENDVGMYIDKAANLKTVVTGDVMQINCKWKAPIMYQFKGFMVQCLNEFPKIKDKSDSFYRRQLFIPMTKCFTGSERKYIKDVYLEMPEVLEYVMYKVLNMNYYELSEPESCKTVLREYKEFNDPVRQFWFEMRDAFVWDLLPFTFLYALYKEWFKKNSPSGTVQGNKTFMRDLLNVIYDDDAWYCENKSKYIRPKNMMDKPELLIYEYNVIDFMNPDYRGSDTNVICRPTLKPSYTGILRIGISEDDDD